MMIKLLIVAGIALMLTSCTCTQHMCMLSPLAVRLSGFDSSSLDTIIVRRYEATGTFTSLKDTILTAGLPSIEGGVTDALSWDYFREGQRLGTFYSGPEQNGTHLEHPG